jgi:hypothetical protein
VCVLADMEKVIGLCALEGRDEDSGERCVVLLGVSAGVDLVLVALQACAR